MASILISGLIPLLQQPGLMLEMEEEREKLLDFFLITQPVLVNAELRAEGDPNVRTWLVDLNAAVYDADDIVDDFRHAKLQIEAEAEADDFRNQNGCRVRASIFPFSCFKNSSINERTMPSGALQGIENRIGSVVNRIDDLVERMRALNFRPGQELNIAAAERRQQLIFSNPIEIRDIFVGRDEEKATIQRLISQKFCFGHVDTIIQGPHGIGKTALARSLCLSLVYPVVWVEVGAEFNIGKVTKSIIDHIIKKDCCISEDHTDLLELRLHQELSGVTKLTVVLDDVCTGFEQLQPKLKDCREMASGNMNFLIITSSFDEMQKYIIVDKKMPNPIILGPLMPDDGWNLFCNKAFYGDAKLKTCPQRLKGMGKKITIRCGGSPLALNMMGSLMRFKKEPEEWRGIIYQLEKEILLNDHVATVETIIKVCYNNLSSQVKQCFAFCSLFPKGHYIDKEVLIKLWMANGLLLPLDGSGSMPPEENGNLIFNELASRHFFENIKHNREDYSHKSNYGYHNNRVTCKMLDLIHEQAVIAAKEFALQIVQIPHLPVSGDSRVDIDIPLLLETNPTVRILLSQDDPFSRTVNCSAVPKANSLRGLHLQCALFERDPLNLNNMRHLRYLDLSRSRIKTLPESTGTLYFLETLNLSKCLFLHQLPENMKNMRSLRHLYIDRCPRLKKMPTHLRQLSNLQTLTTYIVGDENTGTGIDEIKGMHLGGLLELYNLHKVKTPAIAKEAHLFSKTNLDRLSLCWGSEQLVLSKENTDFLVLEDLRPHALLKVLKIQQYGGREFASWLVNPWAAGLENLVELHLIGCSQCETLPAVWKLLSLRVLCLKHMPSLTCIICVDEEYNSVDELELFPSLERLVLVGLKRLERWQGGAGATCSNLKTTFEEKVTLPELVEVEITSCPNLKTMPCLPSLKRISASIENYRLLQPITDLIIKQVEEANIAKASNDGIEPFPILGADLESRDILYSDLRVMRMDSTNSFFMPTTLPYALEGFWKSITYLHYLDIFNCNTLVFWPPEFKYLVRLARLSIRKCPNLIGIRPNEEEEYELYMPILKLELYGCSSLKQLPHCSQLCVLELDECPEVKSVSSIWLHKFDGGLDMLYLSCASWTSLPTDLVTFNRLGTLWVSECYNLTSFPDKLAHVRIDTLIINECQMVKELPRGLDRMLSSLKKLTISKCPQLEKFCKEGPYSAIISQIGTTRDASTSTIDAYARFDQELTDLLASMEFL